MLAYGAPGDAETEGDLAVARCLPRALQPGLAAAQYLRRLSRKPGMTLLPTSTPYCRDNINITLIYQEKHRLPPCGHS
jgi:hypothetical protein